MKKKYLVTLEEKRIYELEVTANSTEDAIKVACEQVTIDDIDDVQFVTGNNSCTNAELIKD